jgi:hypothetical protein
MPATRPLESQWVITRDLLPIHVGLQLLGVAMMCWRLGLPAASWWFIKLAGAMIDLSRRQ